MPYTIGFSVPKFLLSLWTNWNAWLWWISGPSRAWNVWRKLSGLQISSMLWTRPELSQWIPF